MTRAVPSGDAFRLHRGGEPVRRRARRPNAPTSTRHQDEAHTIGRPRGAERCGADVRHDPDPPKNIASVGG